MKAIFYKMKRLTSFDMRSVIIQNMSYVYNKNVKYDKNQKLIYFFCEKPVPKPVKSQRDL